MSSWWIGADTLAESRFVLSPLAETSACLATLHLGTAADPGERAWLDAHLPAYRERLAADPVTALLLRSAFAPGWNADFITPVPSGGAEPDFAAEVALLRQTPPSRVRADLVVALAGPLPAELERSDLAERAADLLEWVWNETVLPTWPRRRRIIEADIVARTARLATHGWSGALEGMRPGLRWMGGGRLQVLVGDHLSRDLAGSELIFVPVTPRRSWLCWDSWHRHAVVYPCSGTLADVGRTAVPSALAALLGPARARVLLLLDAPKSTTQLCALTDQGLGSVGRHLKVLLDARLVQRRRAGRSVLYYRTGAGDALVGAQELP